MRVHARALRGREQAREGLAHQVLGGEGAVHAGERAVGEEDHAVLMDAHAERRPLDEALVAGLALLHHLLGPSQRLLRAHALRHVDGVTVHAGRSAGDGEPDVPVLPDLLVAVLGQHHHQPAVGALALDAVEVRVEHVLDQGRQVIAEAPAHHVLGGAAQRLRGGLAHVHEDAGGVVHAHEAEAVLDEEPAVLVGDAGGRLGHRVRGSRGGSAGRRVAGRRVSALSATAACRLRHGSSERRQRHPRPEDPGRQGARSMTRMVSGTRGPAGVVRMAMTPPGAGLPAPPASYLCAPRPRGCQSA